MINTFNIAALFAVKAVETRSTSRCYDKKRYIAALFAVKAVETNSHFSSFLIV